jgi:aspartate/methionine/tyrosine aminotransferase
MPSCSMAFTVAVSSLLTSSMDEVIVLEGSYDGHVLITEALGGRVVRVPRGAGGVANAEHIEAGYTPRTRAVVLCSPDNPLGVIHPRAVLEEVAALCQRRGLTLIADHCLAQVSPYGTEVPLVTRLPDGLPWLALGDTGKILGLGGTKLGVIMHPESYAEQLAAAQSPWFFQLPQYDLALLSVILRDERLPAYLHALNDQVRENYGILAASLSPYWYEVQPLQAGCFCLVGTGQASTSDVSYANYLRARQGALVVPLSYFWPEGHEPQQQQQQQQVRIALSRPPGAIQALADAMNAVMRRRG